MSDDLGGDEAVGRPGITKLPNEVILLILACSVPFFIFFMDRGDDVRGFVAALSVCAVFGVGAILRRYANQTAFWTTMCGMAVAHGLFVALIPWPRDFRGAGIVFAPLVIVDMYAWTRLVLLVVRTAKI